MSGKEMISIVVPCYNEEEMVPIFCKTFEPVMKHMTVTYALEFELVFIDDGSSDGTFKVIKQLKEDGYPIKALSFSRNFGKEAGMLAGLKAADGDYVVLMDVDLQDPVTLIEPMYKGITEEGYDCVATKRETRKGESKIRSFFAKIFYKIINKISDIHIEEGARDFRMMKRSVVDSLLELEEYNRFSKGLFAWVGFDTKWIGYENQERAAGTTKWSFSKLFKYSLEGIFAFSNTPLNIASFLGVFFCIVSFVLILIIIGKTLILGEPVQGYPSLICLILFMGGVQLFCFGILGKYIAKMSLETKKRPNYIVKEKM